MDRVIPLKLSFFKNDKKFLCITLKGLPVEKVRSVGSSWHTGADPAPCWWAAAAAGAAWGHANRIGDWPRSPWSAIGRTHADWSGVAPVSGPPGRGTATRDFRGGDGRGGRWGAAWPAGWTHRRTRRTASVPRRTPCWRSWPSAAPRTWRGRCCSAHHKNTRLSLSSPTRLC
jgi:hypothetical protein